MAKKVKILFDTSSFDEALEKAGEVRDIALQAAAAMSSTKKAARKKKGALQKFDRQQAAIQRKAKKNEERIQGLRDKASKIKKRSFEGSVFTATSKDTQALNAASNNLSQSITAVQAVTQGTIVGNITAVSSVLRVGGGPAGQAVAAVLQVIGPILEATLGKYHEQMLASIDAKIETIVAEREKKDFNSRLENDPFFRAQQARIQARRTANERVKVQLPVGSGFGGADGL